MNYYELTMNSMNPMQELRHENLHFDVHMNNIDSNFHIIFVVSVK